MSMRQMKGSLSLLGLGTFLQTAAQQGTQGELVLTRNGIRKSLFIDGQHVRLVMASHRRAAMLGQLLVREGKITLGELQEMLAKMAKGGPRLGQLLLMNGKISEEDLHEALRHQSMEELFELFEWEEAEFEFREERPPVQDQLPPVAIMGLVLEAARRSDEYREIRRLLPSRQLRPIRMGPPLPTDDPGLDPRVVRLLDAYLDDERTIDEILGRSSYSAFEIERTLAGLVSGKVLKLVGPKGDGEETVVIQSAQAAESRGSVLVLSELPRYADTLAAVISRDGWDATAHHPGIDLAAAGSQKTAGIVLDLIDSAHGLERVRQLAEQSAAPIVVLASNPTREAIIHAVRAGAREVLIKPVAMEKLLPLLQRLFRGEE